MIDIFKVIFKIYEINHISRKILKKNTQLRLNYNFNWNSQHKWNTRPSELYNSDVYLKINDNSLDLSSSSPVTSSYSNIYDYYNTALPKDYTKNSINSISYLTSNKLKLNYNNFSDSFSFFLKSDRLSNIIPNKKDSFLLHYITLHNFIENMSKSKVVIVNRSSINKHPDYLNVINNTYLLVKKIYKRSVRHFNLYNFIYVLVSSLVLNDIILFKNFVLKKMSGVRFKKHKRLLSMFRYAFRLATSFFFYRGSIKGFFFIVSGKIGIGGSVKRKVWKYTTGSVNLSCKKSKVKYQLFQVWTRTGCLGCKIGLSV